jgi:hypothetical protein
MDSLTPALLQSLYAHPLRSLLSFSEYSDPLGDLILLLPQMENINAFLAFSSSNLLLSLSGYSATQYRSLSGLCFLFQSSKSSSSCACLHIYSTPSWRSLFPTERSVVLGSYAPFAPAQCPPGRAPQNPQ